MSEPSPGAHRVTVRALLIGLLLLPANAWWVIQIEFVRYSDTPTIPQLFFHCVASLFLLAAANLGIRRASPSLALSQGELLTVYTMLVIGSNLAGHDQLQILFTSLPYVMARATPENQWATLIWPHLPERLVVTDPRALDDFLRGHVDVWASGLWRAWVWPVAIWSGVALTVAGTMYCLATLLRRQWEHERLTYPLAEIPLTAAEPDGPLVRSWPFWAGALLAAGLQMLNLAHQIWPAVPGIKIGVTNLTFSQAPWRHMGTIPICFYPFAFGLSFLLPTNLAFSCWFFFLLTRMERVVAAVYGHTNWDGFPYVNQQASGAFVGFGLLTLWLARRHLAYTLRVALGREAAPSRREPLSYSLAWAGFIAGVTALVVFCCAAGMRPQTAVIFWVLLLCIVLAVARVRAEIGLPSIELYQRGADDMMRRGAGTGAFKPSELTVLTLFIWLCRTQRNYNLQHQLHGLRLADRSGIDLRSFSTVVILATVIGVPVTFWAMLTVVYDVGLEGGRFTGPAAWAFGNDQWQKLGRQLLQPAPQEVGGAIAYGFGALVTGLLTWARTRFVWWPLHPAGWVVANSFALLRLWVPLTVTWAVKSLVLKYGGLKVYRQVLPFFLGLVIGEFTAGFLRTLIDLTFGLHLPADSGIGGL